MLLLLNFCKMIWHCSSSIQYWSLNSSFACICINPVIAVIQLRLAWVVWGCEIKGFPWVVWLLINTARVGVKIRVGLEKLFYKRSAQRQPQWQQQYQTQTQWLKQLGQCVPQP